jgi:hypothetical protein
MFFGDGRKKMRVDRKLLQIQPLLAIGGEKAAPKGPGNDPKRPRD